MAHVAKVKAQAVSNMVGHYNREAERRGFERGNIDPARTAGNYAIGAESTDELAALVRGRVAEAAESHEEAAGRALRKDANVLMDWVVTAPQDCPEGKEREFFNATVEFVRERYGRENVPGGFVHVDESRQHAHIPVVPVRDGKLQASKVVNRADLQTFHRDLGAYVDAALGCHVSIELNEEKHIEKAMNRLDQGEMKLAAKRLERLQQEGKDVEGRIGKLEEAIAAERDRVSSEAAAVEAFRSSDYDWELENRAGWLEKEKSREVRDGVAAEKRIAGLRERVRGLRDAIELARGGRFAEVSRELRDFALDRIERIKRAAARSTIDFEPIQRTRSRGIGRSR